MATEETKGTLELSVFRDFVHVAGLPVDLDSIRKRRPPAPDVECTVNWPTEPERVAFELAEVVDQGHARRTSDTLELCIQLEEAVEGMRTHGQEPFGGKLNDASIELQLKATSSKSERRGIVEQILQGLNDVPADASDFLDRSAFPELHEHVERVHVHRGVAGGPFIGPDLTDCIGDPLESALRRKLAKRYKTKHPIELVVYYRLQPARPPDTRDAGFPGRLRDDVQKSDYRRVWIFDHATRRILAVARCRI